MIIMLANFSIASGQEIDQKVVAHYGNQNKISSANALGEICCFGC